MADEEIDLTRPNFNTKIDTRTESTNGNHRYVFCLGDPSSDAGVAPVDATNGLKVNGSLTSSFSDTSPSTQNVTTVDLVSSSASGANSQSIITGTATANSTASFALTAQESVNVQVSGTWTGTLQAEVSMDSGTTWYIRGVHQTGTAYVAAAFTGNFSGNLNVSGFTNFRIRSTAAMTGTAVVRVVETNNPSSIYIANSLKIVDPTTPTQGIAVDSSGRISAKATMVTGAINSAGTDLTPKFAFANVNASSTASSLVALVNAKKIRVLAMVAVTGATATNLTFNSASSAISMLFANGINGGVSLGFNPVGWFETVAGEALTVTTGAGSTTGIQVVYIEV